MKVRSYRGILAVSFRNYTCLFRKMITAEWLPITLAAAVCTAAGMLVLYRLFFFVPLVALAVILEIVTWVLTGRWLAKRTFRKMAGAAKRHWLALTGTTLAVFLTLLPLCVLISMPLIVLILAQWESQSSTLMGDPIGMPSYMPYLIGVVWFLTMFIQICIRLFIVFACYYTYGSAETRRKERTQQKLSIQ